MRIQNLLKEVSRINNTALLKIEQRTLAELKQTLRVPELNPNQLLDVDKGPLLYQQRAFVSL